jgi:hypothetical protein
MKKRTWKRIGLTVLSLFVLGLIVLAIHIYVVTRPGVDARTRIMARIDIRQAIDGQDAEKITAWLYRQKGVDHVLVNPQSDIVIFTFAPMQNSAGRIVQDFKNSLPYKAERYLPAKEEMKGGCPAGF